MIYRCVQKINLTSPPPRLQQWITNEQIILKLNYKKKTIGINRTSSLRKNSDLFPIINQPGPEVFRRVTLFCYGIQYEISSKFEKCVASTRRVVL